MGDILFITRRNGAEAATRARVSRAKRRLQGVARVADHPTKQRGVHISAGFHIRV